jgi:sugar phosphate isomerase/epimerase
MTQAAIQLYTLRDFDTELSDVIHRVADAGFEGVEFAHRIRESSPVSVKEALRTRGVEPVGAHVELPLLRSEFDELLGRYEILGCSRIVLPHVSNDYFRTTEGVESLAEELDTLGSRLDDRGFELVYHNTHQNLFPTLDQFGLDSLLDVGSIPDGGWNHIADALGRVFRFDGADLGRTGYGRLVAETDDENVTFEVDIKNVVAAGFDPAAVLDFVGDRLSMVHVADIDRSRLFPPQYDSVDPGTGMVDIQRAVDLSLESPADWVVFEHDSPSDPEKALEQGVATLSTKMDIESVCPVPA